MNSEVDKLVSCGDRVRKTRESHGLTQSEFGERLGFKWTKVKDIEIGKQKLTPEIALSIEKEFSADFRWLLIGEKVVSAKPASVVIEKIERMLEEMPEEAQRDVLKYAEEKKQLNEFWAEKKAQKVGSVR